MKFLLVVLFALVAVSCADEHFWQMVQDSIDGRLDRRGGAVAFCNTYSCVAETQACVDRGTCGSTSGACNICNDGLGCFRGDGTEDNTCRSTFIGLSCDDGADCQGFPFGRSTLCGTDKVCRFGDTGLVENDYCCDDCECNSGTCINGRCNAVALGGNCAAPFSAECAANQFCNTTTDVCFDRAADGAACPAGIQCLFGASCVSDSTCRQDCSVAIGSPCTTGSCADGAACNTTSGNCQAVDATGLGSACNQTTFCDFGQICRCDHTTGSQSCIAEPDCCAQNIAYTDCIRTNLCDESSNLNDPRSCARAHCGNLAIAAFSCNGGAVEPANCIITNFPTATEAPNRDCGSAGALTSWLSLLF